MAKFRKHRGSLSESMETEVEIETKTDIAEICSDDFIQFDPEKIIVEFYIFDSRINWNTFIVSYPDYGVLGFTNKQIS